jgi:hypothetical protein
MHRIYFDENERDQDGRYDLGFPGSLESIRPIANELHDGMHVILFGDEDLELEAVLEFDKKYQRWMARAVRRVA